MILNASDYGTTGAAIQQAIDLAVVKMEFGSARGATVYVPRVPRTSAWVLDEPIRLGPIGQIQLVGDGSPGAESTWSGTLLDASRLLAGQAAIEVLGGRGHTIERLSIRAPECHGVWLHPGQNSSRTLSRIRIRDVSVSAGQIALRIQGDTDNDQCDTIAIDECQLDGEIGLAIGSKQAVGINVRGGAIRGQGHGVLLEKGFVHFRGTQFGTVSGTKACVHQVGGQSHLTLSDCYAEVTSGDFLRIDGEHWRPTTLSTTRVYMMRGNPGSYVAAPYAYNLRLRNTCTFEQNPEQQLADGSWIDNDTVLARGVRDQAVRLGPGHRPR